MDNYAIFLVSDVFTNELRELLTSYVNQTLKSLAPAKCVFTYSAKPPCFRQPSLRMCLLMKTTQKQQACWTTITRDNIAAGVERVLAQAGVGQHETTGDMPHGYVHMADCVAHLSSTLPKQGAHTELYWLSDTEMYPAIEDCLDLFGALKELYDDYNTDVCLVTTREPCTDAETWMHILRGCVVCPDQLSSHVTCLQWQGSITIQEAQFSTPLVLSGFNLYNQDTSNSFVKLLTDVTSGNDLYTTVKETRPECKLHFISQVELASIPSFYLTSHSYTLAVKSGSKYLSQSRDFLDTLRENSNVGYIVRLYLESAGSDDTDDTLSTSGRSSQLGWSDSKEEVYHELEPLHILLTSDNDDASVCRAHLMTSLSALSPDAGHQLIESELQAQPMFDDAQQQAEEFLSTLPCYRGSQFKAMIDVMEDIQAEVLREWMAHKQSQELSQDLSVGELSSLLSVVRREVLAGLPGLMTTSAPEIDACKRIPRVSANNDYDVNLYTGLERAVLAARAEQQRSFERNQSDESIGGLAPPVQGQVLKLDVNEFLKHFKPDGTPASEDLQTVQLKCSDMLLCHYTHENLQDWGEGRKEKQHDTYFNVGQQADRIEKKCDKLKARLQFVETFSTCSYIQAGSPAAMTMAVPKKMKEKPKKSEKERTPTKQRKSPRKHPRGHAVRTSPRKHVRSRESLAQGRGARPDRTLRDVSRHGGKPERRENVDGSKRLLASQKASTVSKEYQSKTAAEARDREARISRSQRHKKKLEEVVRITLESKGVSKEDDIFKSCAQRLYTLVKCFVKDLATSHNLRQEMTRLAELHVGQVIEFEKTRASKQT